MPAVRIVAVAWLWMLAPALAVAHASAPAADPLDPMNSAAPVPALPDIAPLAGYVPYQAPKVLPWRQSNVDVTPGTEAAADPHAGHRITPGPSSAPTPAPTPAPPAAPASDPTPSHGGHQAH